MINWVPNKEINTQLVNKYLSLSIKNNQFTNGGPVVKFLENKIKNILKIDDNKSVILTNSGTGALHALADGIQLCNKQKYN